MSHQMRVTIKKGVAGLLFLTVILGVCACASRPNQTERREIPDFKSMTSSLGFQINAIQRIQISGLARSATAKGPMSFEALLEIDSTSLKLVGLLLQQRVFELFWNGESNRSWQAEGLPIKIPTQKLLRDIQLVYWPKSSILNALPVDWNLIDRGKNRHLFFKDRLQLQVSITGSPQSTHTITLKNFAEKYELKIESRPVSE